MFLTLSAREMDTGHEVLGAVKFTFMELLKCKIRISALLTRKLLTFVLNSFLPWATYWQRQLTQLSINCRTKIINHKVLPIPSVTYITRSRSLYRSVRYFSIYIFVDGAFSRSWDGSIFFLANILDENGQVPSVIPSDTKNSIMVH